MKPTNREFENENSNRAYPLDDTATQLSDSGIRLPENILIDGHIWFPFDGFRNRLYVASLTVSKTVISVVFASTDSRILLPPGGPITTGPDVLPNVPVAALTIRRPITQGQMHPVVGLVSGVGGWIAFGNGVEALGTAVPVPMQLKFTAATQSLLAPAAVTAYLTGHVQHVGKYGTIRDLSGLITLAAGNSIQIVRGTRTIDGQARDAVIIRLDPTLPLDTVQQFVGPCEGRPEGNTCSQPPIFRINEVEPDCSGNINIVFSDTTTRVLSNDSGTILQPDQSLSDLCEQTLPPLPFTPTIAAPYLEDFNDFLEATVDTIGDFTYRSGTWIQEYCQFRPGGFYPRAITTVNMNARNRVIASSVRFSPFTLGYPDNAFFVFGWQSNTNFWFAGIDRDAGVIEIGNVLGSARTVVRSAAVAGGPPAPAVDHFMQLQVVVLSPASVRIEFTWNAEPMITHSTSLFSDGRIGLMAEGGMPRFDNFRVDWTAPVPIPGPCMDYYTYYYYGDDI